MRIAVFGATSSIGRIVIPKATEREIAVTAFLHDTDQGGLVESPFLAFIRGDTLNKADVFRAIQNCDAVISCHDGITKPSAAILAAFMENLIPLMQTHGPKRLITTTSNVALWRNDQPNTLDKLAHKIVKFRASNALWDSERHLELLQQSTLEWTCLRMPLLMTDENYSGFALQLTRPSPWTTVPKNCVGNALLHLSQTQDYLQQAPFIVKK